MTCPFYDSGGGIADCWRDCERAKDCLPAAQRQVAILTEHATPIARWLGYLAARGEQVGNLDMNAVKAFVKAVAAAL